VEILRGFKARAKGDFVIESPNPPRYHISRANYRAQIEFEALYRWLAGKGVTARKKLHELRKECGAVIANTLGIFAASRALRHADIRITSQYYSDKKVRITTGLDSLLGEKVDAPAFRSGRGCEKHGARQAAPRTARRRT
jgi:hypothetical protein